MTHPPCAHQCGATARCHAHYEQIYKERKPRKKKTEERGRRSKRSFRWNSSKKIDEENPPLPNRQVQATFRTPLTDGVGVTSAHRSCHQSRRESQWLCDRQEAPIAARHSCREQVFDIDARKPRTCGRVHGVVAPPTAAKQVVVRFRSAGEFGKYFRAVSPAPTFSCSRSDDSPARATLAHLTGQGLGKRADIRLHDKLRRRQATNNFPLASALNLPIAKKGRQYLVMP